MLITKKVISMDKETNELYRGYRKKQIDPDFVRFNVYLEPVNPLSGTVNGYAIHLPLVDTTTKWRLSCTYEQSGQIVAEPCSTASYCRSVAASVRSHGCKFTAPTNQVNGSAVTVIDKDGYIEVERIDQNDEQNYEKTNFPILAKDYLTSDCEYSTTAKEMFCSYRNVLSNQVLLKVHRDEANNRMRLYVHFRGTKTKSGLIAVFSADNKQGLIMCFAQNANTATMFHLKGDSHEELQISTGNDMHYEDYFGTVRQAIEMDHQALVSKTGINLMYGPMAYTYKAYISKVRTVCERNITKVSFQEMLIRDTLVFAGNETRPVSWKGGLVGTTRPGPIFTTKSGPEHTTDSGPGETDETRKTLSPLMIALISLVLLFALIAIAVTAYFVYCSVDKTDFDYITMHTDVQTVNSEANIKTLFRNSQGSESRNTVGTVGFNSIQ
ncbi:hypothetical protein HDE_00786 [Halotydeus destructor]|nr:hypothetical protein HDE_00786 [Halotydeus destructor]